MDHQAAPARYPWLASIDFTVFGVEAAHAFDRMAREARTTARAIKRLAPSLARRRTAIRHHARSRGLRVHMRRQKTAARRQA
jgi:hypothetical protein